MRRDHPFLSTALALLATVTITACGAEQPVAPLPDDVRAASSGPAAPIASPPVPTPGPSRTSGPRPTRPPTRSPSPTPSTDCMGPVVFSIPASTEFDLFTSFCIKVGGSLRVTNTGPGTVRFAPAEKVDDFYAAGVIQGRFLHPGTYVVSIDRETKTYTVT